MAGTAKKTFAKILKNYRVTKCRSRPSQSDISTWLGYSANAYGQWERSRSVPDRSTLLKVIKIFWLHDAFESREEISRFLHIADANFESLTDEEFQDLSNLDGKLIVLDERFELPLKNLPLSGSEPKHESDPIPRDSGDSHHNEEHGESTSVNALGDAVQSQLIEGIDPFLLWESARQDYRNDYFEPAERKYTTLIDYFPEFEQIAWAYYGRGLSRHQLGKYREAIEDLERTIALMPEYKWSHYGRGRAYYELADEAYRQAVELFSAGIESFTETIQLDEDYGWSYYFRGLSYKALQKADLSIADFERASTTIDKIKKPKEADALRRQLEEQLKMLETDDD